MALILRKRSTGETLRLRKAKVLCHHTQKLAFLAPYVGQWVFYSLVPRASVHALYNRLPAPARCTIAVGDLLNLKGSEWVIDAVEIDLVADRLHEAALPPACEIEVSGGKSMRVTHDLLIGSDSGYSSEMLDLPPVTALITFAAGRWHLHDLNGAPLYRNGKLGGRSLVLANGDYVRIGDKHLRFHIGAYAAEREACGQRSEEIPAVHAPCSSSAQEAEKTPSAPVLDPVYKKAKKLFKELLPVLRNPGCSFQPRSAACVGLRSWFRILRRPSNPLETLDRLQLLLSASPRDRVWLFELARFVYQQSYPGLCLRLLKELCRLYPHDVKLWQTLTKFYYQQGCNPLLPAQGRLNAFEHGNCCAQHALRLAPSDPLLLDLERAIRMEQTILTYHREERTSREAPTQKCAEALGRMG